MRMRLKWLWGIVPVPIVAADLPSPRLIALCAGPLVIVRPDWFDDAPTVAHELEHCRQFWRGGLLLHGLRYHLSRRYRLRAELDAYRAELRASPPGERPARRDAAARSLAHAYRLGLDANRCRAMLDDDEPFAVGPRLDS